MNQFKIKQESIEKTKKQVWIRLFLIFLLGTLIEIAIKYFHHDTLIIQQVLIIAIVLSITHFWQTKKQIKIFESYVLTISETSFIRELKNSPSIEIDFKDINQIIRTNNGSFKIEGRTKQDIIFIPSYIENYGSLEKSLYKIKPITNKADNSVPIAVSLTLLGITLLYIFASTKNKILITISGLIITFMLIFLIFKVQQNKNLDKGIRRSRFLIILFTIFIFIVMLSRIAK